MSEDSRNGGRRALSAEEALALSEAQARSVRAEAER